MDLPAIKVMEQYARRHPGVVSLSQGIPATFSDPRIRLSVIQALLSDKVDKYSDPQGLLKLRGMISTQLRSEGMEYTASEVVVTAGAIEAMTVALLALLKPGDEIIIPTPTYAAFFRSAKLAGLIVKQVPLNEKEGWALELQALKRAISPKTRAVLLCHPNNPTGSILSRKQFTELCDFVVERKFLLFLDEVYRNMYYGEEELFNPCTNPDYKENIVRVVSFSKDFALTGWRVGFLHSSEKLVDRILPIHDTVINCAPVISQFAALAVLEHADSIVAQNKEVYRRNRQLMGERLLELDEYISFIWPQGSYFFFPKIKGVSDTRAFSLDLVKQAKIAVVPGSDFGQGGEGHIRLCFGRERESIVTGMDRLTSYIKENR